MKNYLLSLTLSLSVLIIHAQQVGHTTIVFNDPSRSGGFGFGGGPGRQILTEIYYPATISGSNVPVANGQFPVVVFGHGFVMRWDAYEWLYTSLARQGFIVALPRTEGEILPNHDDFARDLAIVAARMQAERTRPSSRFFGRIANATAVGGHSMGGKATVLSDKYQTVPINAYFNFSPANGMGNGNMFTDAAGITEPFLVITGSFDKVAPPSTEARPLYQALASSCKTYLNLRGGYHCQFNDFNLNCHTGETSLLPQLNGLTRTQQLNLTSSFLLPFLNFYLKNDAAQGQLFVNRINTSNQLAERLHSCGNAKKEDEYSETDITSEASILKLNAFPNPFGNQAILELNLLEPAADAYIEIYNLEGKRVFETRLILTEGLSNIPVETSDWRSGLYVVRCTINENVISKTIIKE
ncbi:MAG: T9SS type A sorting domain-containing protein [Chitinophagales bacterium]|nr:T9SS type A sorting domain-containing protein [Chitinophagales bacterium]MDW8272990.1 T9SS type A sorting domain-containing protein [Chitinophagales bacterium]